MSSNQERCAKDDMISEPKRICSRYRQYLAAFIVNILSISNGMSAAWTSPVQSALQSKDNPIYGTALSDEAFSWATSVIYFGGFFGILVWNRSADKFGRKMNGYLICFTQIIGWAGIIFARDPAHLIISRFIIGLGGGGIMSNSQLYVSETTDNDIKGPLCSLVLINMNAGILLVYIMGWLLSYNALNIICFCLPVIFLVLFFWLPETPSYLSMNNRLSEAKHAMNWFNLEEIGHGHGDTTEASFKDLFCSPKMIRITLVAIMLLIGQQLSGIGAVLAYSEDIFKKSGSTVSSHASAVIIGSIQLVVSASSGMVIKTCKRKPLLLWSYFGASLSYILVVIYFYTKEISDCEILKYLPTVGVVCFIIVYNLGIGFLPFVMFPEMFPAKVLNHGISLALMVLVTAAFTVTKVFPALKLILGYGGLFVLFSGFNLFFAIFVLRFVWETKDRAGNVEMVIN